MFFTLIRTVLEINPIFVIYICIRVEAAKEAQQKVKEALQKRLTTPFTISKVSEIDKVSAINIHCSSPVKNSLLNSPVHIRTVGYAQDSVEMIHTPNYSPNCS